MGILNQYVESVKQDKGVQKAAMKFNEILQKERKEAEELAAQEKERADQAESRLKEVEKELAELKSERRM